MDKKIKIALLVVIVIAIAAIAYGGISANEPSSKKTINATNNLTEAMEIASEQDKDVFLVFTSDTCQWCNKLNKETLSDEKVMSRLDKEYVTAIVNIDEQPEIARSFNAVATPVMIFLDNNGTEKERLNGFYGPNELLEYM
ncbi:thioredoxin family protein [uncultured Methanobrevibacter sp.]|uniref:thioredoxin family protein n=1 Tax=uncultured Methanobrevibacter sp. TaxID=253161 RepID=UPI0015BE77B3|nr:thioredoxin family protein [uncultured Methanobrevibacter sp.]